MPSGAKKRKAAKRRNHQMAVHIGGPQEQQESPSTPNPNPNPASLPPLDHFQGNGKGKRPVVMEDEGDETFETPRFQPETPRLMPETPYYSMEKMGRIDEIEIPSEGDVADRESSKGLDAENASNDEEEMSKEMESDKSDNSSASEDGERVKESKLDESVHVAEGESTMEKLEAVEDVVPTEKSVAVDEPRTPNASTKAVDVSSSNEKEVKVVPWPDEQMHAVNGEVNGHVELEKGGDGYSARGLERELQKDEGINESKLENLVEENVQAVPVIESKPENLCGESEVPVPVTEGLKNIIESAQKMLPQIDVDPTGNELEESVERSTVPVQSSVVITEVVSQGSKASHESPEKLVGARNVSFQRKVKEDAESCYDAAKVEIAQRNEVARAPPPVRRASLWNCCGLFEVFTSPDR